MSPKSRREQIGEEHSAYLQQQRRQAAGMIANRYPDVAGVVFEFTYVDPDGLAEPFTESQRREPNHSALHIQVSKPPLRGRRL